VVSVFGHNFWVLIKKHGFSVFTHGFVFNFLKI
jgi:hypothetical protein